MSMMLIADAVTRAVSCDPESPVALFTNYHDHPGQVDVRIANTLDTRRRIEQEDPDLIGVYSRNHSRESIMRDIRDAKEYARARYQEAARA